MKISRFILFFCGLLVVGSVCAQTAAEPAPTIQSDLPPDVRVIIDISGSMKQNDPLNLRRPAMELLVQLFPEGSRAGVWTFGQWVNNLVPSKIVDDRWRKKASNKAQQINSVALHTNIPEALTKAMDDIDRLDPQFKQHIILLTDGMVDVSKSADDNARARRQIIEQILPALRQAGVSVHTVALSKNADWELLERLAVETNGLAAIAETAEDLTRIFLQAFDAAAPAEQLPLEGNTFLVDSSIEEFTALVFRRPGSDAAVLVAPDNKQYSLAKHDGDVSWFSQQNYDLITVKHPFEGQWSIRAELEPDSRVTVVSNLSLQVSRLPKSNFVDDDFTIAAVLQEQGDNISRPEFLDLVNLSVMVSRHSDDQQWQFSLSEFNRTPSNGVFSSELTMLDSAGVYDISVLADGKTFQRKQKQTVEVRSDFSVSTVSSDDIPPRHELSLIAQNPAINPASASVSARIQSPDGSTDTLDSLSAMDRKWQLDIDGVSRSGLYRVEFKVSGSYHSGSPFSYRTEVEIEHKVVGSEFLPPALPDPEPEPIAEPVSEPEPEPAPDPEPVEEPAPEEPVEEGMDWGKMGLYAGLVIGNLLVLALGFFAYKTVMGGGKSEVLDQDDDEVADDDDEQVDDEPEPEPVAEPEDEIEPEPEPEPEEESEPELEDLEEEPEPAEEELQPDDIDELDAESLDAEEVDVDDVDLDLGSIDDEDESGEESDDLDDILDLPDDAIDIDPGSDDDKP